LCNKIQENHLKWKLKVNDTDEESLDLAVALEVEEHLAGSSTVAEATGTGTEMSLLTFGTETGTVTGTAMSLLRVGTETVAEGGCTT
jgi:hypothetical protein